MILKRISRDDFVVPPCTKACPAGVDVPRYIRAVKDERYDEAVAVLREKIPFPAVCADVCFAPCEEACAYKQFGEPIAIRAIKRAAVEKGGDTWKRNRKLPVKTKKTVAIVGAGPAGLTAAYYLASKGHNVTVFDSFPKPGGMLRYGIPKYRLPEATLEKEVNEILELGVVFKGNTVVGKDVTLDRLGKDFDALFLASGASKSVKICLDGSEKIGVLWGLDFLRDVGLGSDLQFDGDVAVVGGGNVALDVALTVKRMGARNVHLFCLENREDMPAHAWEIARAEEEGVSIHNSLAPKKIIGKEKVDGLGLVRCVSVFNATGDFCPVYDEETTCKIDVHYVILAIGQTGDPSYVKDLTGIASKIGRIEVSGESLATGKAGVYAGGDAVSGPDSVIRAIAHGRQAAVELDKFLGGDGDIEELLGSPEKEALLSEFTFDVKPRNEMALVKPWKRAGNFDKVELGLTDEQIASESSRCLNCDARKFEVIVNTEYCKDCGYCAEVCAVGTFGPAESFNVKGYRPMECKSSDWCVGCFKCYFACPDFAIDVKEVTA